jgi:peptidoglycan biosynthesis protein MviN/MurJ (putative lipid II flippase)
LPVFEALLGVQRKFIAQNISLPVINIVTIAVILTTPSESLLNRFCMAFTLSFFCACLGAYLLVAGRNMHAGAVSLVNFRRNIKRFSRLAFPLLFATCAYSIAGITDKIIASFFKSGIITSLGIAYSLCFMTIGIFLDPIWKVLFPHFSKLYFDNEHSRLKQLFNSGQKAVLLIFIPISMFYVFFSSDIIGAVFLAKKISVQHSQAAARILSVYGIALIFNVAFFLPSYLLQSAQKNPSVGKVAAIAFSGNIVCSICFSFIWGYIGIPLGTLAAFAVYSLLLLRSIRKHMHISLDKNLVVAAAGSIVISFAGVVVARLVNIPLEWFSSLPAYSYPIAGLLGRAGAFFGCAGVLTLILYRKQLRWLIK